VRRLSTYLGRSGKLPSRCQARAPRGSGFWRIAPGRIVTPVGRLALPPKAGCIRQRTRAPRPQAIMWLSIHRVLLTSLLPWSCQCTLLAGAQQRQGVVHQHEQPHLDTRTLQAVTAKPLQTAVGFDVGETPFHGLLA